MAAHFRETFTAGPAISPGVSNVRFALRPARRVHLDERQSGRLEGSQASCAFARSALCLLRLRGRARLWRPYFQIGRTFGAVQNLGGTARFRDSLFRGGTGQGEAARRRQEQSAKLLRPPDCLARQRNDGGRGAEFDDQRRHRRLGLAEHVRHRAKNARHQARYRRLPEARSDDRAVPARRPPGSI